MIVGFINSNATIHVYEVKTGIGEVKRMKVGEVRKLNNLSGELLFSPNTTRPIIANDYSAIEKAEIWLEYAGSLNLYKRIDP